MTFYMENTSKILLVLITVLTFNCSANVKRQYLSDNTIDTLNIAKAKCFNDILIFNIDSSYFFKNAGVPDTILKNRGRLFDDKNKELVKYDLLDYKDCRFALYKGKVSVVSVFFDDPNTSIKVGQYELNSKFSLNDASLAFPVSYKEKDGNPIFAKEISSEYDSIDDSKWSCIYLDDANGGLVQLYFIDKKLRIVLFDNPKL